MEEDQEIKYESLFLFVSWGKEKGRIENISRSSLKYLGFKKEDLVKSNFFNLIPDYFKPVLERILKKQIEN
jgi:hypothetical protein